MPNFLLDFWNTPKYRNLYSIKPQNTVFVAKYVKLDKNDKFGMRLRYIKNSCITRGKCSGYFYISAIWGFSILDKFNHLNYQYQFIDEKVF